MSAFSWVVFDERERELAQQLVDAFREKGTSDELGLRQIQLPLSDQLFPGITTLHTRLRYALFVPWIYAMAEKRNGTPEALDEGTRDHQVQLIGALRNGGEQTGVIGIRVRTKRGPLPSNVYWGALGSWGIRTDAGDEADYSGVVAALRRSQRSKAAQDDGNRVSRSMWHPALPEAPSDWLAKVDFRLLPEEADFLIDRLVDSHPESVLTHLAKARNKADCDFIWEHPDLAEFPASARSLVDHARKFSNLMYSASLLYNLMISELLENDEWIDRYRSGLECWQEELELSELRDWRLAELWDRIHDGGSRVRSPTRDFVQKWREVVLDTRGEVRESDDARNLVRTREMRLKGSRSRFRNRTALDGFSGAVGAFRLGFRWSTAQSHLKDIADAH